VKVAPTGEWGELVGLTGPKPSTGLPTTFSTRPRLGLPTGIWIGAPVSLAAMPRTRPSVVSMATQRTTLSPSVGPPRR